MLEEAGYRTGNCADFLGMAETEARLVAYRADLGAAIRRLRTERHMTQAAFARLTGSTQPVVARMEIGAPEVSVDLMLQVYAKAGGGAYGLPGQFGSRPTIPPTETDASHPIVAKQSKSSQRHEELAKIEGGES